MKVRVEYESRPIRHIAIQCPQCKSWFYGHDVTNDELQYDYDIRFAVCRCPKCDATFSGNEDGLEIEEDGHPKIYEECLSKRVTWV